MAGYLETCLAKLEEFEGSIPWMYRDTVGNVMVGVGMVVADADAAVRLPFGGDETAVRAEFARVDELPPGRPALFYRAEGMPEMAQGDIDSLLVAAVLGLDGELRGEIEGYDALPENVKAALLDMAYNLGAAGLLRGYPKMLAAVEAGDWGRAAAFCERRGPGAARNAWTREMFEGKRESGWKRLGFGLLGVSVDVVNRVRGKR